MAAIILPLLLTLNVIFTFFWPGHSCNTNTSLCHLHCCPQAKHAADIGASGFGVMPTTFFKPGSIGEVFRLEDLVGFSDFD